MCFAVNSFSQSSFILKNGEKKETTYFKLLSNLIVFPMEVNGKKLNFILDSGVGKTILFNLNKNDSIPLHNVEKIKLQGLGSEDAIDAVLSKKNTFKLNNLIGVDQSLYVIFDENFDLSSKLGITIHGIIGYELLKDFVVTINYGYKKLSFIKPENYDVAKCRKCETFNLEFNMLKPFINIGAKFEKNPSKIIPVKLLIDSGGSDAMWLFENSHPDILPPIKYFDDFLGEGLSGSIYGKRSMITSLVLGKFELKNPTVSFPDSISIAYARKFEERNGSLGGSVLKRFVVTFNYPKKEITLKKGRYYNDPFRYNMSGIELIYSGKKLVEEKDETSFTVTSISKTDKNLTYSLKYNYKYSFKSTYKIHKLTVGSPAYNVGLEKGDIIVKINGKYTSTLKIDEINEYFYQKENKRITIVVERYGVDYVYHFNLENILK